MEPTDKVDPSIARSSSASHVSLLFAWGDRVLASALRENQSLVVGRAESAEIVIDDPSLSRAHARLSLNGGQVSIEDLGSTNGCLLNGVRVTCATVQDRDAVQLGSIELRVCARACFPEETVRVPHAVFMRALTEEIVRARLGGRCVSVLAVKHHDDLQLQRGLQSALKPLDRWCCFAPTIDLVLLPEQDAAAARHWLQSVPHAAQVESRSGIASYPTLVETAEELVSRALDACLAAPLGGVQEALPRKGSTSTRTVILSPPMLRLYELVVRAARTTLPILVHGETGSGKELIARALHDKSPRCKAPFKALNCATIPVGLIESVLFGHERGSFSGADRQTLGVFEQATGGTVFLDEVGELSPQAQAALLRVLEQRCIVRVGATREIEVDVRLVAATHRNLSAMVKSGAFREDLLFRLDALTLSVPPLRERREEIVPLAEMFLVQARERWTASAARLSEDAREALLAFAWPGNVRQLRNAVERAVVVCAGDVIDVEDLPSDIWAESGEMPPLNPATGELSPAAEAAEGFRSLPERVRAFEIALIRDALDRAAGNQTQAARILGVPRRTLASKVHAYDMLSSGAWDHTRS